MHFRRIILTLVFTALFILALQAGRGAGNSCNPKPALHTVKAEGFSSDKEMPVIMPSLLIF